ncbi:hypothetical protein F0562_027346 [Nyssa sinensis]|uniref:Uncharacterized protein n=1 Tax=Nyssa sinensis TaxID=561372 RepID=A0A5J5B560_9ASTE|nr:hypothetical protein F0562_027346 [Nyssa sinensis]
MAMKPHVALLPSPGMGHIIPLFELAKRLVIHHGFRVSFFVIVTEPSTAQNQFLRSPSLPPDLNVIYLPQADMSSIVTDETPVFDRLCLTVRETLRSFRSVLVELNRPSALIIDIFCTDAIDICNELSIPTYSFFTASTALLAFSLYLPKLDREVQGEYVDLPEPVQAPGCKPIRTEDLLDQVRNRKTSEYKWFLFHVSRLPMVAGIFVNTWEDFEPVPLKSLKENPFFHQLPTPPVHPVGPLIKVDEPMTASDAEVLTWLDKQPSDSVLLVALGSGGTLSNEQFTEFAWGLELSQKRFILVARKPIDDDVAGAFFNSGSEVNKPVSYLPEGFMRRTEGVGLVLPSWAPQVAVLRHRSTGGFLSHCGWNSLLESIVHGVPIIAWPLYAEQKMNTRMLVEEVGVAVLPVAEPGKRVIGRKEIERVVRLLMEGDEGKVMRRRARELQESARKALNYALSFSVQLSMEATASNLSPSQNPKDLLIAKSTIKDRDFFNHLEAYLAKRDGVDKLLKISRYATKIIVASSVLPETLTLTSRLKSFESSVGVSRKAFRLGKFVQDVNALRNNCFDSKEELILSIIAYGGEGFYYFVEQFVWLAKSGLIDSKHSRNLQKVSAWAEFIGYIGSISLKIRDLKRIVEDEACLESSIEIAATRGIGYGEEKEKVRKLREKKLMKKLSIVQDVADGLMAVADIRDGKGRLSGPLLLSCAGLLSAIISTHKNWLSC